MKTSVRFGSIIVAAAVCALPAACSKESRPGEQASEAAEEVRAQTEEVREEAQDLTETASEQSERLGAEARDTASESRDTVTGTVDEIGDRARIDDPKVHSEPLVAPDDQAEIADEQRDVQKQARALEEATHEFEYQRLTRIQTLRGVHAVAASQPMLINALAAATNLTDNGRLEVDQKVQALQLRIDQAGNLIGGLEGVDAQNWEARNDQVTEAMERLEDAREGAWDELEDADRLDQTSMLPET